jgi:hypothetical protein
LNEADKFKKIIIFLYFYFCFLLTILFIFPSILILHNIYDDLILKSSALVINILHLKHWYLCFIFVDCSYYYCLFMFIYFFEGLFNFLHGIFFHYFSFKVCIMDYNAIFTSYFDFFFYYYCWLYFIYILIYLLIFI